MSVTLNIKHWITGQSVNTDWKGCRRKWMWSNFRYHSSIYLEVLRKTTNNLSQCSVKIWSGHLPNINEKCYCFSQLDMYGAKVTLIICWIFVLLTFVLYTVMWVGQSINHWMVGRLMNNCWKGCRREWLWSNLKCYSGICLEGLIRISLFPNHDLVV